MKKQLRMHGLRQTAFSSFLINDNFGRASLPNADEQVWLVDWKAFQLPYCSLYVVSPDSNWPCKVGISTNAYKRLMGLQTSVWKPLKVAKCYWTNSVHEARALEKAVHKRLTGDSVWLYGEWFDMRPKDAKEMIEFVSLVEGIELFDKIENQEVIEEIKDLFSRLNISQLQKDKIDRDSVLTFNPEGLATLAKEYKDCGMIVPHARVEEIADFEYENEQRRLPTFRRS